jgi:hypothetical protein
LLDAATRHRRPQRGGLIGGRGGVRAGDAGALAVARTTDRDDTKTEGRQAFAQGEVQIGKIARSAVDE